MEVIDILRILYYAVLAFVILVFINLVVKIGVNVSRIKTNAENARKAMKTKAEDELSLDECKDEVNGAKEKDKDIYG